MAATNIVNTKLKRNQAVDYTAPAAIGGDGGVITLDADEKTVILLEATAGTTAVIRAGDGIQGVGDLTVVFSGAGTKALALESGAYASGGKVTITGANLKAACVAMP